MGLAVSALVVFGRIPGDSKLSETMQNAAHAPAFFALSVVILSLLARSSLMCTPRWRLNVGAFAGCVILGAAIEIVQAAIGGDASCHDVVTDSVGALAGLAGVHGWRRRVAVSLWIALAAIAISAAPVAWCCAAYIHRHAQFPVLAAFHSPLDLYFLEPQTSTIKVTSGGALKIDLGSGPWPGVSLEEPAPDWSGYRMLVVELANLESKPLPLILRVHDRLHNQETDDRYNRRFELPPQAAYRLQIPLADIRSAPRTRPMDLSQIAGIIIFAEPGSKGRSLYLSEIHLQ